MEAHGFIAPGATVDFGADPAAPERGSMGRMGAEGTTWRNFICRSSHPIAAFFHLAFKAAALALYILGGWFSINYVTAFVLAVLLLAFDFWTVKNVSGRLLVGLRWWVSVREDGSNEWQFESAPGAQVPVLDYRIFWWTLYAAPTAWALLAILALITLKFEWLLVDVVAIGLTGASPPPMLWKKYDQMLVQPSECLACHLPLRQPAA